MDDLTKSMDKMTRKGYPCFYFEYHKPTALGVYVHGCGYIYRYQNVSHTMLKRRVNHYFQLVYLVQGEGFLESRSFQRKAVRAGHAFILFPGEWHFYRPLRQENWKEYWITFSGDTIQSLMHQNLLNPAKPLYFSGKDESLVGLFKECFTIGMARTIDGQDKAGICLLQILNKVLINRVNYAILPEDPIVSDIMKLIASEPADKWDFEKIAEEHGISYSQLRQRFFKGNGNTLLRFLNRERIFRAGYLLSKGQSVKEACFEIGMKDPFYFSRLFKSIMGKSPLRFARTHFIKT